MKYALCFPGQGAQEVGMGKALYEAFPSARAVFDEADDALSQHLARLIFEGPDETLKLTANTQPAIMTTSVAALRALENELDVKLSPACGAGHSLGEYTALVASGVLAFRDAVDLVNKRGRWMQESAPEGVGAMAAVMGLEPADIVAVCREVAPNEECQAANFNSPGQVVISGIAEYVDRAVAAAKTRGARKAVMLNVSAPFHSTLMKPAAERLAKVLDTIVIKDAKVPVAANVDGQLETAADVIKASLVRQAASPVLWIACVRQIQAFGAENIVEVGPGKTLTGFNRKIDKAIHCENVEDIPSLKKTLEFFQGGN